MSKTPPQIYRDEIPGQHATVYRGRELVGFVVLRSEGALAYALSGGLVGQYESSVDGMRQARELLLSGKGQCSLTADREGR